MGKKRRVFVLLMAAVMLFGCLCGCGIEKRKDAMDFDDAVEKLEDMGYTVSVVDEGLTEGFRRVAHAEDDGLIIEFCEMDALENSLALQQNYKEQKQNGQTVSASTSTSGENYKVEHFTVDGDYYIIAAVDDTVLLVRGDKDMKDEIKDIAKSFGYD